MSSRAPVPVADRSGAAVGVEWHAGVDRGEVVRVKLDPAARRALVSLDPGWRRRVGGEALGAAAVEAFADAARARLVASAASGGRASGEDPSGDPWESGGRRIPGRPGATAPGHSVDELLRAWRDMREFQQRLVELHAGEQTAGSDRNRVVARIRAGDIVGVQVDRLWLHEATDRDLEQHLGQALTAGLQLIASTPQRALEGCPDLQKVLATTGIPLPFDPPPAQHEPVPSASPAPQPVSPRWSPPSRWDALSTTSPAGTARATAAPLPRPDLDW